MGFQNRFKKVITFPKKHTDNFLGIFLMVKPSYAFWCWICLQLFLEKTRKSRYEKKNSAEGRKFGPRPKSLPKAGILVFLLFDLTISGGPSRRQLYPSRYDSDFSVAYRSLKL